MANWLTARCDAQLNVVMRSDTYLLSPNHGTHIARGNNLRAHVGPHSIVCYCMVAGVWHRTGKTRSDDDTQLLITVLILKKTAPYSAHNLAILKEPHIHLIQE